MKANRIIALVGWLLIVGCEKPLPPASHSPPAIPPLAAQSHLPAPGILRISAATLPADLQPEFYSTSGPGPLALKLEYAGPKTWLDVRTEFWWKGKTLGGGEGGQSIFPPLSDIAAFAFPEGPDSKGNSRVTVLDSIPVKSDGSGHKSRIGTTKDFGELTSLKGRRVLVFKPQFPLEVKDGDDAIVWGVFVDEPEGAPTSASLEERAARAEAAWIFRMGPKDEKKR